MALWAWVGKVLPRVLIVRLRKELEVGEDTTEEQEDPNTEAEEVEVQVTAHHAHQLYTIQLTVALTARHLFAIFPHQRACRLRLNHQRQFLLILLQSFLLLSHLWYHRNVLLSRHLYYRHYYQLALCLVQNPQLHLLVPLLKHPRLYQAYFRQVRLRIRFRRTFPRFALPRIRL